MPPWPTVVVPIVVAVLTIVVNAVVNTTIKFAPDAPTAKRELKRLGGRALRWIINLGMVAVTAYSAFAPGEMTGVRVFTIALGVSALTFAFTATMFYEVTESLWKQIHRLYELQAQAVAMHGQLAEDLHKQIQQLHAEQTTHIEITGKIVDRQVAMADKLLEAKQD